MSISLEGGVKHPKIYAFTTAQYADAPWEGERSGTGLVKIGQTQRDVSLRIREQLAAIKMPIQTVADVLFVEPAVTDDNRVFTDKEVHRLLDKAGYRNVTGEWYECTADEARAAVQAVRAGEDVPSVHPTLDFSVRPEQERAIQDTAAYFREHPKGAGKDAKAPDFLWNAKMRFGKTFTAYQLAREMNWSRILVLTYNRQSSPHGGRTFGTVTSQGGASEARMTRPSTSTFRPPLCGSRRSRTSSVRTEAVGRRRGTRISTE
jgi:hypothetical protein